MNRLIHCLHQYMKHAHILNEDMMTASIKYFLFVLLMSFSTFAFASNGEFKQAKPKKLDWPFDGMTGFVDKQAAQRGLKVYKEVCAACHGINRIAFRNITDIGFSDDEADALASSYQITDGPNDEGEMFEREGKMFDYFPSPYPNDEAAKVSNNGALPPDLSLITKARPDGANYVYSLLTGYSEAPEGFDVIEGLHYNPYFSTGQLAMIPPLISEGLVEYDDGTEATIEQMAYDVVNFLQWTAEPEMNDRKILGFKLILFFTVTTLLFMRANKRVWSDVYKKEKKGKNN